MPKRGSRKKKIGKKKKDIAKSLPFTITLTDKTFETYSNVAMIRSGNVDFIIDFSINQPEFKREIKNIITLPSVVRIHTAPAFIPKLITALQTRYDVYIKTLKKEKK